MGGGWGRGEVPLGRRVLMTVVLLWFIVTGMGWGNGRGGQWKERGG